MPWPENKSKNNYGSKEFDETGNLSAGWHCFHLENAGVFQFTHPKKCWRSQPKSTPPVYVRLVCIRLRNRQKREIIFNKKTKKFLFLQSLLKKVPWPSGQAEVCKTLYSGSNPLGTSLTPAYQLIAGVLFLCQLGKVSVRRALPHFSIFSGITITCPDKPGTKPKNLFSATKQQKVKFKVLKGKIQEHSNKIKRAVTDIQPD